MSGYIRGVDDWWLDHRLKSTDVVTALRGNLSGSRLLAASRVIRVWDVDAGTVVKELVGHNTPVAQLVWLPQGTQFASVANDETIMSVWDSAGSSTLAVANYSVPGMAMQASVLPHVVGSKNHYRVCVSTRDGLALVFDQAKQGVTKPQKFKAKIEFMDTEGEVGFFFISCIYIHIYIYIYIHIYSLFVCFVVLWRMRFFLDLLYPPVDMLVCEYVLSISPSLSLSLCTSVCYVIL